MPVIERILYPTDLSEVSLCALPYALELAERFQAELHCVHVLDEMYPYWFGAGEETTLMTALPTDRLQEVVARQFDQWRQKHLQGAPATVTVRLLTGRPFLEIIRYAREARIDLIVMATHGHGALASMLIGSVAEKVVRKAPCAVLTVRHPEHDFQMPK